MQHCLSFLLLFFVSSRSLVLCKINILKNHLKRMREGLLEKIKTFLRSLKFVPLLSVMTFSLCRVLSVFSKSKEAVSRAHDNIGRAYAKLGRHKEAVAM